MPEPEVPVMKKQRMTLWNAWRSSVVNTVRLDICEGRSVGRIELRSTQTGIGSNGMVHTAVLMIAETVSIATRPTSHRARRGGWPAMLRKAPSGGTW
jgi:hypothetical protein